jgi:hypothetical protein
LIQQVAAPALRGGFDKYIQTIDGYSDIERGQLVLDAQHTRIAWEEQLGLNSILFLHPFAVEPAELAKFSLRVSGNIELAQNAGQFAVAAGGLVWLHSLHAVQSPELRLHGRKLWGLLSRGFQHAHALAAGVHFRFHNEISARLVVELDAIPTGLEPRDSDGNELMPGKFGHDVVATRTSIRETALRTARKLVEDQQPSLEDRLSALTRDIQKFGDA